MSLALDMEPGGGSGSGMAPRCQLEVAT